MPNFTNKFKQAFNDFSVQNEQGDHEYIYFEGFISWFTFEMNETNEFIGFSQLFQKLEGIKPIIDFNMLLSQSCAVCTGGPQVLQISRFLR